MTVLDFRYDNVDGFSQDYTFAFSTPFVCQDDHEDSIAITGRWKRVLESRLVELIQSGDERDINRLSAEYAFRFLELLPDESPEPEIEIDSDGEVAFDWNFARRSSVSVSVGPDGTLRYGALLGFRKRSGSDQLTSAIPKDVLALIATTKQSQSA